MFNPDGDKKKDVNFFIIPLQWVSAGITAAYSSTERSSSNNCRFNQPIKALIKTNTYTGTLEFCASAALSQWKPTLCIFIHFYYCTAYWSIYYPFRYPCVSCPTRHKIKILLSCHDLKIWWAKYELTGCCLIFEQPHSFSSSIRCSYQISAVSSIGPL